MGEADRVRDRRRALAKLTLTLRVTGRRGDGYHLLDSVMTESSRW